MFNQFVYKSMSSVNRNMQRLEDTVSDVNNVFTNGYKGKETTFHETINGMQTNVRRDLRDGIAKTTSRELDFAIQGKGYFEVQLPDGTYAYTRDGSFTIGPNGELLSSQGYQVITSRPDSEYVNANYDALAEDGAAFDVGVNSGSTFIPVGSQVTLGEDGALMADDKVIGKLNVVTFTNEEGLQDIGENLYMPTPASGDIADVELGTMEGQTEIKQGYLESSNVSIVKTMSDMVQLNTIIKAELKVIKTLDQMQENLTSTITRSI